LHQRSNPFNDNSQVIVVSVMHTVTELASSADIFQHDITWICMCKPEKNVSKFLVRFKLMYFLHLSRHFSE